jgi:hypothetical protein
VLTFDFYCFDRSFQTEARWTPTLPDIGVASDASVLRA